MKNILLINPANTYGGQAKHVVDIIKNIDQKKYSLYLLTPPNSGITSYLKSAKVTIISMKMLAPYSFFKILKINKIDLIHLHNSGIKYGFFMRLYSLFQKRPVIMTEHLWTKDWQTPRFYLSWFHWLSMFLLSLKTTKFIAVSHKVKEFLEDRLFIPTSKVVVIYNGIKDPLKSKTSNSKLSSLLISVGNLNQMKNHQFLIKAFAHYLQQYNDSQTKLQIYGSGPLQKKLNKQIKDLQLTKRIYLKGWSDNLDPVYKKAKGMIIPSTNETFCYVAVESMMYKVPIIATKVGSLPEILGAGLYGCLVPINDLLAMSKAIHELLNKGRLTELSMGEIRQHAISAFSIQQMIKSLEKTYSKVLRSSS